MKKYLFLPFVLFLLLNPDYSQAEPTAQIAPTARCPVCGMFVAKYNSWITQLFKSDDTVEVFDGVKDMFAYYFSPSKYEDSGNTTIKEIWVKDYYSLQYIDGKTAFYVIGSDVYGPMGHELIPFATSKAAESFKKDHKGKKILTFQEITEEIINELRTGNTMR